MTSNEKCGDVFFTDDGLTIYHCVICNNKYKDIQKFGIHIISKHYNPDEDFDVDDLMPDIPDVLLQQSSANTETINDFSFESEEEDSDSDSSLNAKLDEIGLAHTDDEQDKQQCGEVDLTPEGMLIFRCTLCVNKYEGVREFDKHVLNAHYATDGLEEIEFEMLWPENDDADNTNFGVSSEIDAKIEEYDENESSHVVQKITEASNKQNVEKTKKPTPKWRQVFETFRCPIANEEKYKCKLCGVVIRNKSNTQHHIRRVHENFKPHKCSECPKQFHSKTELKIHIRKHTGERPYLCVECGIAYMSASELHRHRETNHKQHVRDKICQICGKSFYAQKHLRAHAKVHSEERPFKCEVCQTGFKEKNTLRTHMRIHEDKRQYKCNLCSASYNYKSILNSHMKSKHALASEKS